MYEPRFYRQDIAADDLTIFEVREKETDLLICATSDLSERAYNAVLRYRSQIESFAAKFPVFLSSYAPVDVPADADEIIRSMASCASVAEVGPMAAVAGAMSEFVARELSQYSDELIIENGGDIYIKSAITRKIGIYAGDSVLSNKLAIVVKPEQTPVGICTSSGKIGHSTSFGLADAVVIMAKSATLADAVATRVGNMVRNKEDIKFALEYAQTVDGVMGAIIVVDDGLGGWGSFEFVPA